jgi:hypothetical protein
MEKPPDVITFQLDLGRGNIVARLDTGTDYSVVHPSMISQEALDCDENVSLTPPFGMPVEASLVRLSARMDQENSRPVTITCAKTDKLTTGYALISLTDYKLMTQNAPKTFAHMLADTKSTCIKQSSAVHVNSCRTERLQLVCKDTDEFKNHTLMSPFQKRQGNGEICLRQRQENVKIRDTRFLIKRDNLLLHSDAGMAISLFLRILLAVTLAAFRVVWGGTDKKAICLNSQEPSGQQPKHYYACDVNGILSRHQQGEEAKNIEVCPTALIGNLKRLSTVSVTENRLTEA